MNRQYVRMMRRSDLRDMTGRCTITRGTYPNVTTVASNVRCLVRPSDMATRQVEVAGQQVTLHTYQVKVPDSLDVVEGDVLTVTGSADGFLAGRFLTVLEVVADEWVGSRRLVCHESRA